MIFTLEETTMKTKNLGKILAGVGLAGVLGGLMLYPTKIKPVGWGDVTGDGVQDVLTLQQSSPHSPFWKLGFIDGNKVYRDEKGDYRFKIWTQRTFHEFNIPPFRTGEGIYRSASIQRLGNNPGDAINLDVFTTIDVEPFANHQSYANVQYQ